MVSLFSVMCMNALVHLHLKWGVVWFQSDTQSIFSECMVVQIQQSNSFGCLFQMSPVS